MPIKAREGPQVPEWQGPRPAPSVRPNAFRRPCCKVWGNAAPGLRAPRWWYGCTVDP